MPRARPAQRGDPVVSSRRERPPRRRARPPESVWARPPAEHRPALRLGERAGQAGRRGAGGVGRAASPGCRLRLAALLGEPPRPPARWLVPRRRAARRPPPAAIL